MIWCILFFPGAPTQSQTPYPPLRQQELDKLWPICQAKYKFGQSYDKKFVNYSKRWLLVESKTKKWSMGESQLKGSIWPSIPGHQILVKCTPVGNTSVLNATLHVITYYSFNQRELLLG